MFLLNENLSQKPLEESSIAIIAAALRPASMFLQKEKSSQKPLEESSMASPVVKRLMRSLHEFSPLTSLEQTPFDLAKEAAGKVVLFENVASF